MEDVYLSLIAENKSDCMSCISFASPFRSAGYVVIPPLSHRKVKKQIASARKDNPSFLVIVDGEEYTIIDEMSKERFKTDKQNAIDGLLELWDDYITEPTHPVAAAINVAFKNNIDTIFPVS